MRKWYERRIDISVSLCLFNIYSQSFRYMVVAVWEHCVYHCLHVQTGTTLGRLLQNFLAKKEINELHVRSSVNRNRFFTVKALIKSKKLAGCKGTNDCLQILQQEILVRDHGFKVLFLMWKSFWPCDWQNESGPSGQLWRTRIPTSVHIKKSKIPQESLFKPI